MRRSTTIPIAIGLIALACFGIYRLEKGVATSTALAVEPEGDATEVESLGTALPRPVIASGSQGGDRDQLVPEEARPLEQRATVEIRLVGLNGPAAGALVVPGRRFYARQPVHSGATEDEAPKTEFTTDSHGKLILEVTPSTQGTLLFTWPDSKWQQQITWGSPRCGKTKVLQVRFPLAPQDRPIQVRSFPSGVAIQGARISVGSASTYTIPKGDGITDRLGVANVPLTDGPTKDPYKVSVAAEGHSGTLFVQAKTAPNEPLIIWLTRHASLSGTVALSEAEFKEKWQPNATVYLVPRDAQQEPEPAAPPDELQLEFDQRASAIVSGVGFDTSRIRAQTSVATTGEWEMPEIKFSDRNERLEDYVLVVRSEHRGRLLAKGLSIGPGDELIIEDDALRGPPLQLDFAFASGDKASQVGTVTLVPISDIGADNRSWKTQVQARIDHDGRASFPSLPPGTWRWDLWPPGGPIAATGTLKHNVGHPLPHSLTLDDCASVAGRIVGQPTVPTRVYWRYADDPDGIFGTAYADDTRRFRIPLLAAGRTIDIIAVNKPRARFYNGQPERAPDWGPKAVTVTVDKEGISDLTLELAHPKPKAGLFLSNK